MDLAKPTISFHPLSPGFTPPQVSGGGSYQAQNACHPPLAGHDNPAGHPAASVMVWVRVIPPQRLADPLAVGVAAATVVATHALVVQHGVNVHGALLALQSSLGGGKTAGLMFIQKDDAH